AVSARSYAVRVPRRLPVSHLIKRPCRSRVLPFACPDGLRNTLTAPVSSSQRRMRLLGMSLQSKALASPSHTGPSVHLPPLPIRSTVPEDKRYRSNEGCSISIAGSGHRGGRVSKDWSIMPPSLHLGPDRFAARRNLRENRFRLPILPLDDHQFGIDQPALLVELQVTAGHEARGAFIAKVEVADRFGHLAPISDPGPLQRFLENGHIDI